MPSQQSSCPPMFPEPPGVEQVLVLFPTATKTSLQCSATPLRYLPHLKKVIKRKGRPYLFFHDASPKRPDSQIKAPKCLMRAGSGMCGLDHSRSCAAWHSARGTGPKAAPCAAELRPQSTAHRSAIFTGEEFFLIGPHRDIRAIFKEV